MEKGNLPYPRFLQCDMFVPQNSLNGRHLETALCRRGMEREWRLLTEEDAQEGTEMALTVYRVPFYQVTSFKYLGRIIAAEDDNWLEVVRNLIRARNK